LFAPLATMRCGDDDAFRCTHIAQPNGSADSEPHDTHTVWFTDAVTVPLSGEQFDVALNDTRGGVVSTDTALNAVDTTSLDTPHRASASASDVDNDSALLWLADTAYVTVYVPLPKSATLDDTLTLFIVHAAAPDRPGSPPSDRTMAVSVDPGPNTPADGDSCTATIAGVSRTVMTGTDDDDTVDSRMPDSAACVALL
jgi:hypothetical protein